MPPSDGVSTRLDGWLLSPGTEFGDDISISDAPSRIRAMINRNARDDRPFIREIRARMRQRMEVMGIEI
jgi:hypothetical protein